MEISRLGFIPTPLIMNGTNSLLLSLTLSMHTILVKRRFLQLKNRKFDWLPVILLSLIVQYIILQLLLYVEIKIDHSISLALLTKINFFIVAIVGGLVAMYLYIKNSPHLGGICAVLFIVLSQLYIGNSTINGSALLVLLVAYVAGYIGALLYTNKVTHKRFR